MRLWNQWAIDGNAKYVLQVGNSRARKIIFLHMGWYAVRGVVGALHYDIIEKNGRLLRLQQGVNATRSIGYIYGADLSCQ